MNVLKEGGKTSLGRGFSIIVFILIFLYCIAPFFYHLWGGKIPQAPDILVYIFMVSMGYVGNTKWVNTLKKKYEGPNVDSKLNN